MAQEIKRIEKEFIFKNLVDNEAPVSIHAKGKRYHGRFLGFVNQKITLELDKDECNGTPKEVTLFFRFRGTAMTATSGVHSCTGKSLQVYLPSNVYRDLSRSFERVQPEGDIQVSLVLEGERFQLDFPASETYYEPDMPALDNRFDPARIAQLLQGFREKVASFASENKIIMFRERKPETAMERLVAAGGKVLLLPFEDIQAVNPGPKGNLQHLLISEDDIYRLFKDMGEDPMTEVSGLEEYVKKRKAQRVWHELYCPVLYHEYVVGYILLIRTDVQTSSFSRNVIDFVVQFSRLLSYSLQKNGYFKAVPVKAEFKKSELVDISGSGMLFSFPLDGPSLRLFMDLELVIHAGKKRIPCSGRIMRLYRDSGRVYVGVQFLDMKSTDHGFLLSYIYGSDYDGKIEVAEPRED